eukprot:TRINITY_DN13434_c0_g1_i1.p1 TRINITY_DN13434_c0_g1~~TRINITY_DN13434_c0_g1_i1.p1  ORF type:complete len:353 (-),score=21.77 TRINITY_DN13434_c0_g1_i1:889-1947(-)
MKGEQEIAVSCIDMGYHVTADRFIRLVQVLPAGLAGRANFFQPLKSSQLIMRTFFQAPGASEVVVGCPSSVVSKLLETPVTIVFCSVCNIVDIKKELSEKYVDNFFKVYLTILYATASAANGYVSQNEEGDSMLSFFSASEALQWCILMQHSLLDYDWPNEILKLKNFGVVKNAMGVTMFNGPRVKMAVCRGVPHIISPHPTNARADYVGAMVGRAARLVLWLAEEGQIITTKNVFERAFRSWHNLQSHNCLKIQLEIQIDENSNAKVNLRDCKAGQFCQVESIDLGVYQIKGISERFKLVQVKSERMCAGVPQAPASNKISCIVEQKQIINKSTVFIPNISIETIDIEQLQ